METGLAASKVRERAPLWRRPGVRRAAVVLMVAAFAVEAVVAAPYLARGAAALGLAELPWLAVAIGAELLSMRAFARMRRRLLAAGGLRLPMHRVEALTYAATAVGATFPGGSAVSSGYLYRRLRAWGATAPTAGFTVLASAALSTCAFAILGVFSAVAAGQGLIGSAAVLGVLAIVTVVATLVARRSCAGRQLLELAAPALRVVNRARRRAPDAGLAAVQRLAGELSAIRLRRRDWGISLYLASLNWLADLVCLVACCQAVGVRHSSVALLMLAYVAGMSLSSVSFSPGGLGIVDAAMIFALTQGGERVVFATAGVLLYRLVSFGLVVSLGWLIWLTGRLAVRARRGQLKPESTSSASLGSAGGLEPAGADRRQALTRAHRGRRAESLGEFGESGEIGGTLLLGDEGEVGDVVGDRTGVHRVDGVLRRRGGRRGGRRGRRLGGRRGCRPRGGRGAQRGRQEVSRKLGDEGDVRLVGADDRAGVEISVARVGGAESDVGAVIAGQARALDDDADSAVSAVGELRHVVTS